MVWVLAEHYAPDFTGGEIVDLTEREREVLAWFIGENWQEFAARAEEFLGVNGLHRLAEKLKLDKEAK
jgi:hypothetical protein